MEDKLEELEAPQKEAKKPTEQKSNPVRIGVITILVLIVALLAWYLVADRYTPYTNQARVHTLVVPISSQVSGSIISVDVKNNQRVKAGQLLFTIDPEAYQFAVDKAEADLKTARQSEGASTANIDAAKAQLITAQANLVKARKDRDRFIRIQKEDPGAISERRIDSAEASYLSALGKVATAKAKVSVAQETLGDSGDKNSMILQAQSALDQAKLNLEKTFIRAKEDGFVTDVRIDKGNFASAGAPQLTFIATHNVWVQADFTENNLGHIRPDNNVKIVFDVLPGQVLEGTVREIGLGVAIESTPRGSLPTINNNRDWLRTAQRYAVLIDFPIPIENGRTDLRVGSQASVIIYTGEHPVLNTLADLKIWLDSILTYAY